MSQETQEVDQDKIKDLDEGLDKTEKELQEWDKKFDSTSKDANEALKDIADDLNDLIDDVGKDAPELAAFQERFSYIAKVFSHYGLLHTLSTVPAKSGGLTFEPQKFGDIVTFSNEKLSNGIEVDYLGIDRTQLKNYNTTFDPAEMTIKIGGTTLEIDNKTEKITFMASTHTDQQGNPVLVMTSKDKGKSKERDVVFVNRNGQIVDMMDQLK